PPPAPPHKGGGSAPGLSAKGPAAAPTGRRWRPGAWSAHRAPPPPPGRARWRTPRPRRRRAARPAADPKEDGARWGARDRPSEARRAGRAARVEIGDLIGPVADAERRAEEGDKRFGALCRRGGDGRGPRMPVERPADELSIFRPTVERVGRRVHADKAAAGAD